MFKKTLGFMVFTVSFVLTACTSVPPVLSSDSVVQDAYSVSSEELNSEVLKMHNKPLLDWDDEVFRAMHDNPRFGGYFTDSGMLTLQMKSEHGEKSDLTALSETEQKRNENDIERAKKNLIKLLSTSPSAPVFPNEQGQLIPYTSITVNLAMVKVSYNRLYIWRKLLRSAFSLGLINELYIDRINNKLFAGVNSEQNRIDLLRFMTQFHISSEVVTIQIQNIVPSKTVSDQFRPVLGGIEVTSSVGGCTLGLPVLLGALEGYLIASHCTEANLGVNSSVVMSQANQQIGVENNDPPNLSQSSCPTTVLCRYADVAFIKNTGVAFSRARIVKVTQTTGSKVTLTNPDGTDQFYDVTSAPNRPTESAILSNVGATSGWKQAKVVNPSIDQVIAFKPPVMILGIVKISSISATYPAGCGGDSGSPWYLPTSTTTAAFYGVQSASTTDSIANNIPCGSIAYLSPVQQITAGFGTSVVTYTRP